MTMTQTTAGKTLKIEDMEIGHRYVRVNANYEANYIVASVERRESECEVWRNGRWTTFTLVTVTYSHGATITHEIGTEVYVEIDVIAQ